MSDNPWLRDLARVNREREAEERSRLDERWDRLSAGELSPEEEGELRALAETSEETRQAYEAFRPLGADFQARVVGALAAELKNRAPAEPRDTRPRLLPFRPAAARLGGWLTAAAAAAVLIVLLRPPAPLPDYASLDVSGGSRALRGEETPSGEAPAFAPGDHIQVVLSPSTTVSKAGRLEALCFLTQGQELRRLELQTQLAPSGAVKMEGALGRDLRPGTWTLWAVVGRRDKLPDPADLRSLAARAQVRQRDWVALPKQIRIQPRRLPP